MTSDDTPDTGDDTLRDEMADVLQEHAQLYGSECSCDGVLRPDDIQALHQVDALMPLIRDHIAAALVIAADIVRSGGSDDE